MSMVSATTMLDRKTFLIKERVAFLKLSDAFDIYDPASGSQIGIAREKVSLLVKLARLLISKRLMPTTLEVREREDGPLAMSLRRGVAFLHAHVSVRDAVGQEIGRFKSKLFSIGGGFHVLDPQGNEVADIKGDWKGWNFRFLSADGSELGKVTKKWAGIGKEFFTSADNYMIALDEHRHLPRESAMLLLAAGLAIDSVYKEK
jgi:uncharacterized protein YxjI